MLKDQFYNVSNLNAGDYKASADISLNPEHSIYQGHFPGTPVTPGVCQLQIIKEIISEIQGKALHLSSAKNIKFLNVLVPGQDHLNLVLEYTESNSGLNVTAVLSAEDKIFLKFTGHFQTKLADLI